MSGLFVGIDLGTTYSVAAVLQAGRPTPLPNVHGEVLTPSAVSIEPDGTVLVGAAARARAITHPRRTAVSFKRDMGTARVYELGDHSFRPEQLSALVLQQVARDVEAAMGRPIDEAVVTVPAYFGELQRRATRDACTLAGLPVQRIINEPTAAALAYGLQNVGQEQRVVVLDLGGGTFDVSVLEIIGGVVEIQASAGDVRLGGEDFVTAMVDELGSEAARALGADVEDIGFLARLREACERTKRVLSRAPQGRVLVTDGDRDRRFERSVTREEAEGWWRPLLDRLRSPIMTALRDARLEPSAIDMVLLVGGATRMPSVARVGEQLFGVRPRDELPPDEAVAMGAAVQAALKADDAQVEDLIVTDIAPFSLGVSVVEKVGHRLVDGVFTPVIERGTVLPASRVKTFTTTRASQTHLTLEIFQGESALCQDNQRLGNYTLGRLPLGRAGKLPVEVRFTYDLNGLLEVEATVPGTNGRPDRVESFVIEREPGTMTHAEIETARREMARLKFHPRDALPNVVALERAEALHTELLGGAREVLRDAIVSFLAALDEQDPQVIERRRETLVGLTLELGRAEGDP